MQVITKTTERCALAVAFFLGGALFATQWAAGARVAPVEAPLPAPVPEVHLQPPAKLMDENEKAKKEWIKTAKRYPYFALDTTKRGAGTFRLNSEQIVSINGNATSGWLSFQYATPENKWGYGSITLSREEVVELFSAWLAATEAQLDEMSASVERIAAATMRMREKGTKLRAVAASLKTASARRNK